MDAIHIQALELIAARATTGRADAISRQNTNALVVAALDLLVIADIARAALDGADTLGEWEIVDGRPFRTYDNDAPSASPIADGADATA